MKPGVLISGGSPAGLQAALDLADAGIEVLLAEISPFIGDDPLAKHPRNISNTHTLEAAKQPRIHLLTHTELKSVEKIRDTFKVGPIKHIQVV